MTHWIPVILQMQMLMSRFVFPLNYQKTESQSSSQNAKVPITKSLEDFMIDRLPNQSPVHDLQVHVFYFLLIKIVCTHWFFLWLMEMLSHLHVVDHLPAQITDQGVLN